MLFILTKELWQTVRYCARNPLGPPGIWYWTVPGGHGDVVLGSHKEKRNLTSVIREAAEATRTPVPVVAASSEFSEGFQNLAIQLAEYPWNIRICLIVTNRLDDDEIDACREFLQRYPQLAHRVSTLLFAGRFDTDRTPLDPAFVTDQFRSFLRLLCEGGESLAHSLGLFREPPGNTPDILEDYASNGNGDGDGLIDYRPPGILAALGVQSWLPRRQEIIRLTEGLLSMHVAEGERRASVASRTRGIEPEVLIGTAMYLGMTDEPLSSRHFFGMIPPPPDTPFERWKIPFSRRRARKQTHHLQRVLQKDFAEYTRVLEETLDEISGRIRRQSAVCFADAAKAYRYDALQDADMGTLSLLARDYYPSFALYDEPLLADIEEEPTGWPPDESLDLFCEVYEAMDEGLDRLPGTKAWAIAIYIALALFLAAGVFWTPGGWLSMALSAAGVATPLTVWIYRLVTGHKLRRRLVDIAENVFRSLRESFDAELQWILRQTRTRLERDIRLDAIGLGDRIREEFEQIPFVFTAPEEDREEARKRIRELEASLIHCGVEKTKIEPLAGRLDGLATAIIERVTRQYMPEETAAAIRTPREIVEEWLDELIGSSKLPLEKVADLREEVLAVASAWRSPPLMAALTDAELHRRFRKVVVLPDTDIVYQRICEALPTSSGNSAVALKGWMGPAAGIAICSVVTGLPDSILDQQHSGDRADRAAEQSLPLR